ncbi:hypothetical protein LJR230_001593 [Trinickia sp. LjRoot230]|uniref:hypothetical protein n=1 Tax=Trinickia sp. LjRoot230 TaxID=3342288 RepID=UPI003ECCF446
MNPSSVDERDSAAGRDLHAHVCAYNMAFAELGLRFRWDTETLATLLSIEDEAQRIVAYIEAHQPHLLTAYSAEFLSQAILARKNALRPEALPSSSIAAIETNRPSAVQTRIRGSQLPADHVLPTLAGA